MAKIFQGLGPKRRESCNGDRVYSNVPNGCFYDMAAVTLAFHILECSGAIRAGEETPNV